MLVEYRWMLLVYYTTYVLITNTSVALEYDSDSKRNAGMLACAGASEFDSQLTSGVRERMWGDDKYEIWVRSCQSVGPCAAHTCPWAAYQQPVAGCRCSLERETDERKEFGIHVIIVLAIWPVYTGLILFNLVFKSGGFDGATPNKKYIQSLQDIQTKKWFRTYTNVLLAVLMTLTFYAVTLTWSSSSTTLNLLAGGLALVVLVPTPRRTAPTNIVYDSDAVAKARSGLVMKLSTIVNWNSTMYMEEAARLRKKEESDPYQDWHEITNYCEIPVICA